MITIVSMSRRPDMYRDFVNQIESKMGRLVSHFFVFVNNPDFLPFYKSLEASNEKIRVFNGPEDFVYRYGHDTVYNFLEKKAVTPFILKLFDTDSVEVDPKLLEEELKTGDLFGMNTYMERGDVWEMKYQLYRAGILTWYGLVHENQHLTITGARKVDLKSLKVLHHNALDTESSNVEKTADGFIILKKTQEGTDSDRRNMLYESLAWKIVNEAGRQDYPGWFKRHYEINREVIDWYYERAKKKFKL